MKREVVEPWLRQLSELRLENAPSYLRLEVEESDLFDDFKKHLSFAPSPYQQLEKLKEVYEKYSRRKLKLSEHIAQWAGREFGQVKAQNLHLALLDHGLGLRLHREWPDEYPLPAGKLDVYTDRRDSVDYYVGGHLVASLTEKNNQDLAQTVGNTVESMLSEVGASRFSKEFDELTEVLRRMRALREGMERVLRSHLRQPTFRGICRYLR